MVPGRKPSFSTPQYRYLRSSYRPRHLLKSPRVRVLLLLGGAVFYAMNFFGGDHGLFRRMELARERDGLVETNARLRLEKERLVQEVQLQENDPMSLERLAREKYWMIGPEEKIYRFQDDEVVADPVVARPARDSGEDEEEGSEGAAEGGKP